MTEVGAAAKRRTTRKLPGDSDYKPTGRPISCKRSPYPTRPIDIRANIGIDEEVDIEVSEHSGGEKEVEGDFVKEGEESSEGEERARREESELAKLMRYMVERDERNRGEERERMREEEQRRREHREEERERRREDEERRREQERAREQERERNREEERERRRKDEEEARERRDLQQEKRKVLGSYREPVELMGYLEKFERIMREFKIEEGTKLDMVSPKTRKVQLNISCNIIYLLIKLSL